MKTLITGGARAGKSAFALKLAAAAPGEKLFIATAEGRDGEMRERIAKHQAERGPDWKTIEEPRNVAAALTVHGVAGFVLLDCLTLWTSNLLEESDEAFAAHTDELAAAVAASPAQVAVVTNEVGWGIVPADPLTRRYRDRLGLANARVAAACGNVVLMVAGVPLYVKGKG